MKRLLTAFFGFMLIASFAQAADLLTADGVSGTVYGALDSRSPISITQNTDPSYMDLLTSVSCGVAGSHTTQNWYLRRFLLPTYGIVTQLDVQSVDMGIEQLDILDGITTDYTFNVKLFTIPNAAAFLFANMTEIANVPVTITPADAATFINVPITGTVLIGSDLVVAIDAPDGTLTFTQFRPGVNNSGYTATSYLAAADCGITEPTSVVNIGFPQSQLILVVNGDADPTTATENLTFSSLKSLY
jgi:hypothetical protein